MSVERSRSGKVQKALRHLLRLSLCAAALLIGTRGTQNAVANGETRSISIMHMHTKETLTITYKRDGYYDAGALEKLNWALRDWRRDEPTKMDPRLFDILWEVHNELGSSEAFRVVSAYRSPQTNAMLRRRSRMVAEHSQHMLGKAMDFYLPDASPSKVREIAMRMQRGGVGYYPTAYTPFTHLDVGSVRSWPRMTRDQLVRLFPNGNTVHLPADGQPLGGYEVAKAEILARGGSVAGYAAADLDEGAIIASGSRSNFWTALFGGGSSEEEEARPTRGGRRGLVASRRATEAPPPNVLAYADNDPLGRFNAPVSAPAQPVPLRERMAAQNRPAPAPVSQPPVEDTRVAALEPSPAAKAQAAATLAQGPKTPQPQLVDAPLPLARPRNLPDLSALTQVAALADPAANATAVDKAGARMIDAPAPPVRPLSLVPLPASAAAPNAQFAANTSGGTPMNAPMPPARPIALASLSPEAAGGTAAASMVDGAAPSALAAGKLVAIQHPAPPARPATEAAPYAVASIAPANAPPPAQGIAAAERNGLNALFTQVRQASPQRKPQIITAKARVEDTAPVIQHGESPAAALGFSKQASADIRTDRFSGPAVRPLPASFVQN